MSRRNIVICGNGAGAALLLCALARRGEAHKFEITVIGTGPRLGAGIAYASENPNHLLNVPTARMSADPLEPGDFENWLAANGKKPADDFAGRFVSRFLYADYLDHTLKTLLPRDMQKHVRHVSAPVRGLIRMPSGWTVLHGQGSTSADLVVLATGIGGPAPIAARYRQAAHRIIDIPWGEPQVESHEDILVLGTGLTAIDTAISLLDRGHRGKINLLSRHGLLPATHVPPTPQRALAAPYPKTARALLHALKARAGKAEKEWQGLMDAMRPYWPQIWAGFDDTEKDRALRHGLSHWNRHRHRVAPQAAARLQGAPNVNIIAGRLAALTPDSDNRLAATITRRGQTRQLQMDRVINCTGPALHKNHDPLIENLIASRQARTGKAGLGLDVDDRNRVMDADGTSQPTLFALGALTRGRWWEITAIPEISRQAMDIAGHVRAQFSIMDAAGRVGAAKA